jgi:hypothetical protein
MLPWLLCCSLLLLTRLGTAAAPSTAAHASTASANAAVSPMAAALVAADALMTAATVAEAPLITLCTFFIILMYFDGFIFEIDIDAFP